MRRPNKRTLLILVATSLLVPAVLLSLLGLKLLRDFTEITGGFRAEYGDYVARIAASSVEDAFWEQEQLNMVSARLDPPRNPGDVALFLDRFRSENPHYLLAFFVVPEGLVHYSQLDLGRTAALRPLPRWIVDPIMATLDGPLATPSGLNQITSPDSLPPMQVTYFTIQAENRDLLGAAGFVWDLDYVKKDKGFFERVLARQLEANQTVFRGAIFQSPVVVTLLDDAGQPFYTTAETDNPDFIALRPFRRVLSFYQVGIQLSNNRFDAWVHSVVRTNLAIIVAMLLVIVLAVIFALRFIFHEMELAEVKSTLVSNVSHELKTPLALIRLFSETLRMDRVQSPEKEKEFLDVIHKESERLTHLIDNVLDMNRIEQGRKTYNMRPTNLSRVVADTLEAYQFQLKQKGFEVQFEIDSDLPPVSVDADAMTQALLNLMDNAIKYSAETKMLRVTVARRGDEVVISVEDKGIGISPHEQGKIFDMFYRVEKGLVHSVKGSGLGLPLVRHVVDAHGGRISVDSRPGRGSKFSIFLPLPTSVPEDDGARKQGQDT